MGDDLILMLPSSIDLLLSCLDPLLPIGGNSDSSSIKSTSLGDGFILMLPIDSTTPGSIDLLLFGLDLLTLLPTLLPISGNPGSSSIKSTSLGDGFILMLPIDSTTPGSMDLLLFDLDLFTLLLTLLPTLLSTFIPIGTLISPIPPPPPSGLFESLELGGLRELLDLGGLLEADSRGGKSSSLSPIDSNLGGEDLTGSIEISPDSDGTLKKLDYLHDHLLQ